MAQACHASRSTLVTGGDWMTDRGTESRFALLADGSTVEISQATPADAAAVQQMHERLSPANAYFRFFSFSQQAPQREAQRLARPAGPDHVALLARLGGELVGVASYELTDRPGVAEVAFAVADEMHGRGIATLLLEHLVSLARQRHLTAFAAETMPENVAMLRVFADAGLVVQRRFTDGVIELTMPLPGQDSRELDSYLDAVAGRASRADVASLRPILQPASIAVVGAGRHRGSVGREILHNIVTGGFGGTIYPVNPRGGVVEGLTCRTSPADLPDGVDIAIVAVPAEDVATVAEQCGSRGVRALAVISAGLGDSAADLLAICREYGMRLVGPNCYGIAVPALRLNASFAATTPLPGDAGLVVQSGGIGLALLEQLSRLGIGVSSFASVGDKYDVSGNDLLTWWEQDEQTSLAILYLESFGNPRGFARTARRVGRKLPVLTVVGGRSAAGRRAAESHTAGATPLVTQEALFGQAGIVATHSLGELVEAAAFLAAQPLPAGRRVAIVSNAGGAGALAADACSESGLTVVTLSATTCDSLRGLLPSRSAVTGPVDTTGAVEPDTFRACLELVAADEGVDALLAIGVRTAVADLTDAIRTARVTTPIAAALLDRPESVSVLTDSGDGAEAAGGRWPRRVPVYGFPESAARALARAVAYREWRDAPHGQVPELEDVDTAVARALVSGFLGEHPDGAWLSDDQSADLLACYQIQLRGASPAGSAGGSAEVVVEVVQQPVFGPLVVFGLGGPATGVLAEQSARLAPLTDADADIMIGAVRAAPMLLGRTGSAAVAELLLRVSRLADDLPEVAGLELRPVIARPDGVHPAAARVRIAPAEPRDPFLRQLR
jgi:acyl-CoA synthetase (NDP forming)/RimJ/RimL family protein N-acetyltransferase